MKKLLHKLKVISIGILMMVSSTMILNPSIVEASTKTLTSSGSVELKKEATIVDGMLNEWEVNLSLEVKPKVQPQDIVVVMDRSGSMKDHSRMVKAREAAKLFVNTLLDGDVAHDNRIALISYSSDVRLDSGFTTNKATLNGKIDAMNANGGTFSQGALHEARLLTAGTSARADAKKIIVFLSDGAPTFGYALSTTGKTFTKDLARTQLGITTFNYRTNLGSGSSTSHTRRNKLFSLDGLVEEENLEENHFDYSLGNAGGSGNTAWHFMQTISGNNETGSHLLINLYKTLVSEAKYAKAAENTIYTIALDLDGDTAARESLTKVATDSDHYFSGSATDLEDQFKEIAQDLQMPFKDMKVNDPMGDGFTLVTNPGPEVTIGTATGLTFDESQITWDLTSDSFVYNTTKKLYEVNVKYRVRTNTDAIPLLEGSTTGKLPTNKNAVFTYTENDVPHTDSFPVPVAKPTILAVTKDLYDSNDVLEDLHDDEYQRQYKYLLYDGLYAFHWNIIDDDNDFNYHILQQISELQIFENEIINDNILRFDVAYSMVNHAGNNPLVGGKFTLVPETGFNTIHIENRPDSTYIYDDFTVEKTVVDANNNTYAELNEILTYTITIDNLEDVFMRHVQVQDTLSEITAYVQDYAGQALTITRNGVAEATTLTVADLVEGFEMMIAKKETVKISFDVQVKTNTTLPDHLNNTVKVNDKDADASIPALTPVYDSAKSIVDENEDGKAEAGEKLTYTISVINDSKVETQTLTVRDELTELLPHIQGDPDTIMVDVGGTEYTLTQLIAGIDVNVPANTTLDVVFTIVLTDDFDGAENQKLTNIATVGDQSPEAEIDTIYPVISANKSVLDHNENGVAEPGEELRYVISATNDGEKSKIVTIKDEFEAILPHIKEDPSTVEVKIDTDPSQYKLTDLIAGIEVNVEKLSTVTVAFKVTLKDDFDTKSTPMLKNIAAVNGNNPESEIPTGEPIIKAEKRVVDEDENLYAEAGEELTYTIHVKNSGNLGKENVLIKDKLEELVDHIKDANVTVTGLGDGKTLQDLIAGVRVDLAAGQTIDVEFTVTLKDDFDASTITKLKNMATVDHLNPETEIETGYSNIIAKKSVQDENGDGFAEAGEVLTYTINIKNTGNLDLEDVLIKDSLDKLIAHIVNPDAVEVTIGDKTHTLGELRTGINRTILGGEDIDVIFNVTLKDDFDASKTKNLSNIATVGEETPGTDIPTGEAIIEADKMVEDENGNDLAEAGEALTYTISVKNTGTVRAKKVLIKDEMKDLKNHIQDPTKVVVMVGDVEHTLADLIAGIYVDLDADEVLNVWFTVVLKDDFDAKEVKVLKNIATVHDETPEAEISTGYHDITASKHVLDASGDGYAEAGEALTYTITVLNSGNIKANDVWIKDDLANLIDHLWNYESVIVKVGSHEYSLKELMAGIEMDVGADEFIEIVFTVVLKEQFDAKKVKHLMNMATVNDLRPEATIETYVKDRGIKGVAKPDVKKPKTILPITGQSSTLIAVAGVIVIIGLGLVLRKREEDE